MSARKCGTMIAVKIPVEAPVLPKELFLSGKAFRVLKKIRQKCPDFDPATETEIWIKARRMGLTEEE